MYAATAIILKLLTDGFDIHKPAILILVKTDIFMSNLPQELIKVRGFQVAPPELEGVLLGHPDIVDVAVIGITDSAHEGSELPRAYVQRRPGSGGKPSAEDVQIYMRERLASYKALTGGVVFIDAIPKNQSGKILKRILREQAKKETGAKL